MDCAELWAAACLHVASVDRPTLKHVHGTVLFPLTRPRRKPLLPKPRRKITGKKQLWEVESAFGMER